jgi:hypothetical protein
MNPFQSPRDYENLYLAAAVRGTDIPPDIKYRLIPAHFMLF